MPKIILIEQTASHFRENASQLRALAISMDQIAQQITEAELPVLRVPNGKILTQGKAFIGSFVEGAVVALHRSQLLNASATSGYEEQEQTANLARH